MSVQFDAVVKDRQLIIHKLVQLQNAIPERKVLSWNFFVARLQQLFVEAELSGNAENANSRSDQANGKLLNRVKYYHQYTCISQVLLK